MKIALSTNGKNICEALFREYQAAGIEAMEISTTYDKYADLDYDQIGEWAKEYGITLWSFHLPFGPFEEIDLSRPDLWEKSLAYFESLIQKATSIGIHRFIVHPSGEPIAEEDRPTRLHWGKRSLAELAEIAAAYDAVIAVENLPRTCLGRNSQEMLELISAHPALRICFDTNHLLGEDPVEFVQKVGKHFITMHVSDYDFLNERHWLPGEGKLDWQALLAALEAVGYSGPWLYEVSFTAPVSIVRPRNLCCDDFVRNARKLFEKKPLTVLGKPVGGLTGWQ